MKRNIFRLLLSAVLMMCCTVSVWAGLGTPPDNEIWYTSSNGKVIEPYDKTVFGATYQSNTYENGKGVIKFDKAVTKVGDYAFYKSYITGISLPNTVKSIGKGAFYWSDLAEISFGNSVESIGDDGDSYGVFAYCDKLTHIDIPNTVTSIGKRAFYDCDALEAIGIPASVTSLGESAFYDCDALKAIGIPASVTSLGESAFYDCNKLKFAAIGCGVTNIPQYAFSGCNELKSVAIDGNGVTLGYEAFYSCEKLESVSFFGDTPPSYIGDYCFSDCSSDLKFHVLEGYYSRYNGKSTLSGKVVAGPPYNEIWYTTNNGGTTGYVHLADFAPKLNACMGNHCVQFFDGNPPGFSVYENCFEDCTNLVSVVMPSSITSIGKSAFWGCTSLVSVSIPSSVTSIGVGAFKNCGGLQNIKLPDAVDYIGEEAFENCWSLQSVTIPNRVTSISKCVFEDCTGLHSVTILGTIDYVGDFAFCGCGGLYNIFYFGEGTPDVVTELDHYSFKRCPATIYVKDVTGHDNWGNNLVCSWRSGKGDGTKESPLEIGNYQQLYGFSLEVAYMNGANLCAKLTNDITGSSNVLNEDGTPKGIFNPWLPIGGDSNEYKGEFDGQGHTISGLYINDKDKNKIGLFGRVVQGANIHNLGVKDSYFSGNNWVAGICGDFNGGSIENCWNGATVISNSTDKDNCCAGGIAASCWKNASVNGCYNIGKVTSNFDTQCGGICGTVAKNSDATIKSISNCVSLEGKCDKAYNKHDGSANIDNVVIKNASAFASGEVCWILNGNKIDTGWRQQIGTEKSPVLTGNILVNHSEEKGYYNETLCEENGVHYLTKVEVHKCDGSTFVYWHCTHCGKYFTYADRTKEETDVNTSFHFPEYVMGIVPTETTEGRYGYYQCTKCHEKFKEELCSLAWTNDSDLIVPKSKNNEIWYTTTNNQKLVPYPVSSFGAASYKDHVYEKGLGVMRFDRGVTEIGRMTFRECSTLQSICIPSGVTSIEKFVFTLCSSLQSINIPSGVTSIRDHAFNKCASLQSINIPSGVTSIGDYAFSECASLQSINIPSGVTSIGDYAFSKCASLQSINIPSGVTSIRDYAFSKCASLQSINIPSGVTSIGDYAFSECGKMESIIFNSLPNVVSNAFNKCNISTKILDLTDSDKPYIGTSLDNYPGGFTEARYHRTLVKDTWGTIVLPFKPSAESTEGLKFYVLQSMTTGGEEGGSLTFMKVDAPDAGIPFLFRNEGESVDFTLTAEKPSIILETQEIGTTGFTMKGSFQQVSLNTTEKKNDNLYYLKDNEFYHANGQINIAPFRAYIEGDGAVQANSFILVVSDNGEDITAIPGVMEENGDIDETEGIYDTMGRRLDTPRKGQVNIIRTKTGKTIKMMM